jgi:hypothetical protein
MRVSLLTTAIALQALLLTQAAADCVGSFQKSDAKAARFCCEHRGCHDNRRRLPPEPRDIYRFAEPPRGILVSSVPVIEPSLLLSQNRYIAATPQVRAISAPRSLDRGGVQKTEGMSDFDRLSELENSIRLLQQQLREVIENQIATLEKLKAHGIE